MTPLMSPLLPPPPPPQHAPPPTPEAPPLTSMAERSRFLCLCSWPDTLSHLAAKKGSMRSRIRAGSNGRQRPGVRPCLRRLSRRSAIRTYGCERGQHKQVQHLWLYKGMTGLVIGVLPQLWDGLGGPIDLDLPRIRQSDRVFKAGQRELLLRVIWRHTRQRPSVVRQQPPSNPTPTTYLLPPALTVQRLVEQPLGHPRRRPELLHQPGQGSSSATGDSTGNKNGGTIKNERPGRLAGREQPPSPRPTPASSSDCYCCCCASHEVLVLGQEASGISVQVQDGVRPVLGLSHLPSS